MKYVQRPNCSPVILLCRHPPERLLGYSGTCSKFELLKADLNSDSFTWLPNDPTSKISMGQGTSAEDAASSSSFATARAVEPAADPMGESLKRCIQPKVHQLIRERSRRLIVVMGKYAREAPYIIADSEKSDKPFNRHRPTARVVSEDTLELACFTRRDYVKR
jgi:hypothetical protein